MSIAVRQNIAETYRFLDSLAKADILDEGKTNTYLIAALEMIGPCLITSVRSDHGDDSSLGPHGHSSGFAADIWPNDDTSDLAIARFLESLIANTYVWTIGTGGLAQGAYALVTPPKDDRMIVFPDNTTNHIHIQAANKYGSGLRA